MPDGQVENVMPLVAHRKGSRGIATVDNYTFYGI